MIRPVMTALALIALSATAQAAPVQPLERAHAHNDYEHGRPLLDALDHGFTSVEADIWLVDGKLLVAHDAVDLDPARTLRKLYLDPLKARIAAKGGVYDSPAPFRLLIDVKTEARATWAALNKVLAEYDGMLSRFGDSAAPRAVTAIVSGNRAKADMQGADPLRAGYDGRLSDLNGDPASFTPLISYNWNRVFSWRGVGAMPTDQRTRLNQIVATAHEDGQIVRFWATPDAPGAARDALWRVLIDADVDLINTDDLAGLSRFLKANDPQEVAPVPLPAPVLLLTAGLVGLVGLGRRASATRG